MMVSSGISLFDNDCPVSGSAAAMNACTGGASLKGRRDTLAGIHSGARGGLSARITA
jgi:hypothetical protein